MLGCFRGSDISCVLRQNNTRKEDLDLLKAFRCIFKSVALQTYFDIYGKKVSNL